VTVIAEPAVHEDEKVLRVQGLSKTFGGTRALVDVDLDIRAGEIHALVGQNGSGKSTLIKALAGYHQPDTGAQAWFQDEEFLVGTHLDAHDRLRFVHQDLGHVLELGVIDNLALRGAYVRGRLGRIRWSEQERTARELLARFGVELDLYRPLAEATPVERVVIAIVAAIQGWEGSQGVLVLDEPTAVLPPHEVEELFELIGEVRRAGASVLYVSHRLDEIFELADRVTVLRGGRVIGTHDVADIDAGQLASLMVGEEVDPDYRAPVAARPDAPVVLEARDVHGRWLRGVDLDVHRGEILGIAGLAGAGVLELPYVIAGCARHPVSGRLRLPERSSEWSDVADAAGLDIPLVPADRGREGIVAEFAVSENLSLSVLGRLGRRGRLDRRAEAQLVERWTERLGVVAAGPGAPISTLSGGNQQKVVVARCLVRDPALLVLCEPTAGVDIGTRVAIYELIAELSRNGLTVVLSSSDAGDVLAMCTRVVVLRGGKVAAELGGEGLTEHALVSAMEGEDR
jgi:ABC-type sugar transport system ATPase subunit